MTDSPQLSLIIPAYNERRTIEELICRVDNVVGQTRLKYELIVVDDGSVDDTRKRAIDYANNNSHVKVVSYKRNIGKGHAIKTGFARAKGDAVVFMDSDLDIDPRLIVRYAEALKDGDLVIASKRHPYSKVSMPLMRSFLSRGFNVLVKLLTGLRISDTQTGLKAVRKSSLEEVFSKLAVKRYAFDVELLVIANLRGMKIVELPVHAKVNASFSLMEIWRMFIDLLGITYRLRISKYYSSARIAEEN